MYSVGGTQQRWASSEEKRRFVKLFISLLLLSIRRTTHDSLGANCDCCVILQDQSPVSSAQILSIVSRWRTLEVTTRIVSHHLSERVTWPLAPMTFYPLMCLARQHSQYSSVIWVPPDSGDRESSLVVRIYFWNAGREWRECHKSLQWRRGRVLCDDRGEGAESGQWLHLNQSI